MVISTNPYRKYVTDDEWVELVTLDYVLTRGYSDNKDLEEKYKQLSNKIKNHERNG